MVFSLLRFFFSNRIIIQKAVFQFLDFRKWNNFVFVCLFSFKHEKFCSRAEQRELTLVKLWRVQKFLEIFETQVKLPMQCDFSYFWSCVIMNTTIQMKFIFWNNSCEMTQNFIFTICIKTIFWMTLNDLEWSWMNLNDLERMNLMIHSLNLILLLSIP